VRKSAIGDFGQIPNRQVLQIAKIPNVRKTLVGDVCLVAQVETRQRQVFENCQVIVRRSRSRAENCELEVAAKV
jgi:hypothetical protein